MAETDVVVVLSDEEEGEGGEVVDADGAPILSGLKKRNISVVKSKTVQIGGGGGGGGGGGATMVGLHRNPSGQSTLAFDRRIKNSAKRRGPQEEHDPDKVDKKMAKVRWTLKFLVAIFLSSVFFPFTVVPRRSFHPPAPYPVQGVGDLVVFILFLPRRAIVLLIQGEVFLPLPPGGQAQDINLSGQDYGDRDPTQEQGGQG